jgi:pimeloyl-ACP methyl ester carboxylesterase
MKRTFAAMVVGLGLWAGMAGDAAAQQPTAPATKAKGIPGTFTVPLDHRTGTGQLTLAYTRFAATGPRRGTVVFLAGGPGQAATPLAASVANGPLARLLGRYDLVFLDQRGTGKSGALTCSTAPKGVFRVASSDSASDVAAAAAKCADELGPARAFYTTYETALDIEDLRVHLGVPQVIPLGVSYGGQVAGEYARRFPASTQALILDSTSPIEGGDLLSALPQLALPRVLRETCFPPGCERLFADPTDLLAATVERMGTRGLKGKIVTPAGKTKSATIGIVDLYELIRLSDLDPALRLAIPSGLEAASRGDADPLLRLAASQSNGSGGEEEDPINEIRMLATDCVEGRLPWAPDSDPATRPALLAQRMEADAAKYAPFPVEAITPQLEAALCVGWPATPAPPRPASQGPNLPVLILGGRDDLRTPLEDQRRAGFQFPNAKVVAVPNVGHSVLSSDQTGCAIDAVTSFLFGRQRKLCPNDPQLPLALPVFNDLDDLPPIAGSAPREVSRTLVAVDLTMRDLVRQYASLVLSSAGSPATAADTEDRAIRLGGLRGGRAELRRKSVVLRDYEVVEGVQITGRLDGDLAGTIVVTGIGATGTLRITEKDLRGTLDGTTVRYRPISLGE